MINLTQVLTEFNGKPIEQEGKELTLKVALTFALSQILQEDDGQKKLDKYLLAMKINDAEEIKFTGEQTTQLKEAIGKIYGPFVSGMIWCLLEGEPTHVESRECQTN